MSEPTLSAEELIREAKTHIAYQRGDQTKLRLLSEIDLLTALADRLAAAVALLGEFEAEANNALGSEEYNLLLDAAGRLRAALNTTGQPSSGATATVPASDNLTDLLARAKAAYDALTPEEQKAHRAEQRENGARAEAGLDEGTRELDAQSSDLIPREPLVKALREQEALWPDGNYDLEACRVFKELASEIESGAFPASTSTSDREDKR